VAATRANETKKPAKEQSELDLIISEIKKRQREDEEILKDKKVTRADVFS